MNRIKHTCMLATNQSDLVLSNNINGNLYVRVYVDIVIDIQYSSWSSNGDDSGKG